MLYGRAAEQAQVDRLLANARSGRSGVLVVRGQPGIGKTALLGHLTERAAGVRVLHGVGVESEAELPYAALHLLLRSELHRIDVLPEAQAAALRGALGLGAAAPENRFLVGLAVLSLLAEVAGDGALLCLVDEAQWFDRASIDALVFVARRLDAEGIALVFAGREEFHPQGLPELWLDGVDRDAAVTLLAESARDLAPKVRDRVLDEAGGNPLALIELPSTLTSEQQAGQLNPFTTIPVANRVQQAFQQQIRALPDRAQALLAVLAADDTGDLGIVLRAAESFSAGLADLEAAEQAKLVTVNGAAVAFRHPLIRAAAYQNMPLTSRLAVRRALAEVLVGGEHADRRAWHLAAATTTPDEDVARELELAAERARTRSGFAAMAAAYERAAELTPDTAKRSVRLAAAAVAASDAGQPARAGSLADRTSEEIQDPLALAHLIQVRAHREFEQGSQAAAGELIITGAERVARLDAERAAYLIVEAVRCGWYAGDPDLAEQAARLLRALPRIGSPLVSGALGLAALVNGDLKNAVALMQELVLAPDLSELQVPGMLFMAQMCAPIGRYGQAEAAAARVEAECRAHGMDGWLTTAVETRLQAQMLLGGYREAATKLEEIIPVIGDLGQRNGAVALTALLALACGELGDEQGCRTAAAAVFEQAGVRGLRTAEAVAVAGLGRLELALGRPKASLKILERISAANAPVSVFFAPDRIEAAVKAGEPERAREPLAYYLNWAAGVGVSSADAVALRCRALVENDEDLYEEAARAHEQGEQPHEQARTRLLYGEWLRRSRKRAAARAQLRAALETFDRLGMMLWAERARAELRATGDVPAAPRQADDPLSVLTAQERQVVRLAAAGASNRDIAAQLYLSPRTVGYHLYKAFPKLGISSRAELAAIAT
ncbi:AAA family ATPase [Nonomuraea rhodomycinica]|uniref:AAA family ATPase n=1 Tax=Nonomuraea rhodomycinica TaxID=1712872 RepID=A0A7Y6MFK2_9ACTN|nr:helix-turn-helix transcriptional regulator [Nonomuraea rhodomycinica]NUW44869.1 AAA family ATPase [Nonomuraea rhodomycinica]